MTSIQIEVPEHLLKQLEDSGLLDPTFLVNLLAREVERRQQQNYNIEDAMAALDELDGMFEDENWTMEDIYRMKQEEKALEERKLNRL